MAELTHEVNVYYFFALFLPYRIECKRGSLGIQKMNERFAAKVVTGLGLTALGLTVLGVAGLGGEALAQYYPPGTYAPAPPA